MQNFTRKPRERTSQSKDRSSKDDLQPPTSSRRPEDIKVKKPASIATPRSSTVTPKKYVTSTTAADIYSQNNKRKAAANALKAPKKATNKTSALGKSSNSPMTNLLSSPSSISQRVKSDGKSTPVIKKRPPISTTNTAKNNINSNLGPVNVTVNSPPVKRKLHLNGDSKAQDTVVDKTSGRQRQKTRTLREDEVVVLTHAVDNNKEMLKLTKNLKAKPKAFFVDLGDGATGDKPKPQSRSSEDEVSYEDDFESYESDFESYHSGSVTDYDEPESTDSVGGNSEDVDATKDAGPNPEDVRPNPEDAGPNAGDVRPNPEDVGANLEDVEQKDYDSNEERSRKDEERMLDSGSFDLSLRESQRSANRTKAAILDFIKEDWEAGLTDEGFQDMAKTSLTHVEVLDRPLFIDFTKSKEIKRKRKICEHHRQRAKDLLSMITLHEMSYSLFEMKPIPYDLYMATFGKSNYVQTSTQTYDDGVNEEIQTDEVFFSEKWTQHPVRFSNEQVCLNDNRESRNSTKQDEDYLKKFTFLLNTKEVAKEGGDVTKEYLCNPLRIYFEQKDGVGASSVLPQKDYEAKLNNASYSVARLKKFLKKVEGRTINILRRNTGNTLSESIKPTELPFSKGYTTLDYKNLPAFDYLKHRKITTLVFSDTKNNLLMTVHEKTPEQLSMERALVCLWDISTANAMMPLKVLVAIETITLCRFRGNTDGIFVSALGDGSIHLWDLSEDATICKEVASDETSPQMDIQTDGLTQTEIDREWNAKNRNVDLETVPLFLQACAYTSSAANITGGEITDEIVGLELLGNDHRVDSQDGGRKIIGQLCSLQRIGVLTIWMIVQEKETHGRDIGKAIWSKLTLERNQSVLLSQYVDLPTHQQIEHIFNLTAAKRRLLSKKHEKRDTTRPKSSANPRPNSAANVRNQKPAANLMGNKMADKWESGMLCSDLKVCKHNKVDNYLVSKSCGEVLICTRVSGTVKIDRFLVTNDKSLITVLATSPHGLPYFLAASEAGTVSLCSLVEMRVLLTLDCRNVSLGATATEKYQHDRKGRYIGTVAPRTESVDAETHGDFTQCPIRCVLWPRSDPCCITAVTRTGASSAWQLTRSDIHAWSSDQQLGVACAAATDTVALLTPSGEVRLHRLKTSSDTNQLDLFLKYVALL